MNPKTTLSLHLQKQNFKFSAAHFLIFDEKSAERLHGHNYQVSVDLAGPPLEDIQETGFFIDFKDLKEDIKAAVDAWDERVLLPEQHLDFKFKKEGPSLQVWFRERYYVFPQDEVILLPISNTSVENLAGLLAAQLLKKWQKLGVFKLRIRVEETRGQAASVTIRA